MKTLTHISLYLLYAVVPTFASVVQNFDSIGTPYTIKTYDSQPPAAILSGGPTGNFMRLVNAGVTWQQNEIAFDKTDNPATPLANPLIEPVAMDPDIILFAPDTTPTTDATEPTT